MLRRHQIEVYELAKDIQAGGTVFKAERLMLSQLLKRNIA
jgi:hypothetical protein